MKILLMQNEEYESGFKILRREESNFYTKHFEELCGNFFLSERRILTKFRRRSISYTEA